jgi:DNA primase
MIPESTIEEILNRVDIVELISASIPLKRQGRTYKALCPFHHEKTPSFVVSSERQIFHCFGCSAGGNALSFLMQYERMEFPEAIEALAKKAGVTLHQRASFNQQAQSQNAQIYKINEAAVEFYVNHLYSADGKAALAYLLARGIMRETLNKFRIGFAPDKWDGLLTYLRSKSYATAPIEKAGLIIPKDAGGYYDRFRGRIIIPVIDAKDRVVAFGARVLPAPSRAEGPVSGGIKQDEGMAKYVNSPETPVYTKGKVLFGLSASAEAIRAADLAVIVEGYFDLIAIYQAGIKNIAAPCGTALTVEQIRLLKRYSQNVVMAYDADSAGQMAALRSLSPLVEEGMRVRVVSLPGGYDPDSYVRAFGRDKFLELIAESKDVFDYKLEALKSRYNPANLSDKAAIASEMLPLIMKFNNEILKSAYVKKLAEGLKVDEGALLSELKKMSARPQGAQAAGRMAAAHPVSPLLNSLPTERLLVKLMLEEAEIIEQLKERITPYDFRDSALSRIASRIFDLSGSGKKVDAKTIISQFEDARMSKIICELTACEGPKVTDRHKLINDCIGRLKDDMRKLKQQEISEQIKLAEASKNELRLRELLTEFQSLSRSRKT